jgi:hypothetical protein
MGSQPREKGLAQEALKRTIYLLIAWQERRGSPDEPAIWRFSLENARTGHRHGFGDLEALIDFFRRWKADVDPDQSS